MKHSTLKTALLLISSLKMMFGYIGPGTGLTAIGTAIACIVGTIVAVLGFLWYPLRRMLGHRTKEPDQVTIDADEQESDKN